MGKRKRMEGCEKKDKMSRKEGGRGGEGRGGEGRGGEGRGGE